MRKYIYIFKSELMSSLQYVSNLFINFIGYIIFIFVFLNLWNYIYTNPDEIINGYTKNQMIWYIVITELIYKIVEGRKFCRRIIDDVKGGNIVYNINKPYSYIGYAISSHMGEVATRAVFNSIFAFLLGLIFLGNISSLNFTQIIIVIISMILAIIINTVLIICIGLLSFKIEDANPVYWLFSKVILILGTIFPIEFFPEYIQIFLKYSPVYVISYGPANLFVNFNYKTAINILAAQVLYLIVSYGLCAILYKKGVKKLNVNGG